MKRTSLFLMALLVALPSIAGVVDATASVVKIDKQENLTANQIFSLDSLYDGKGSSGTHAEEDTETSATAVGTANGSGAYTCKPELVPVLSTKKIRTERCYGGRGNRNCVYKYTPAPEINNIPTGRTICYFYK